MAGSKALSNELSDTVVSCNIHKARKAKPREVTDKIIIGSLKGNTQGLGKDIVAEALRSAGFQVIDLGVNVAPDDFVETAIREHAQIIAVSVSVDETVPYLKNITDLLRVKNMKGKIRIIVGGRAVNEQKRQQYGTDAYAADAGECVRKAKELIR